MENPYHPPSSDETIIGVLSGTREDLRNVAKAQKGILVCILIYLIAVIVQFAFPPEIRPLIGLVVLLAGLVGAVFTFMLAIRVYGTGLGILFGILCLIPCIGLIILLVINAKATNVLKKNGIKVGLLGADLSTI